MHTYGCPSDPRALKHLCQGMSHLLKLEVARHISLAYLHDVDLFKASRNAIQYTLHPKRRPANIHPRVFRIQTFIGSKRCSD